MREWRAWVKATESGPLLGGRTYVESGPWPTSGQASRWLEQTIGANCEAGRGVGSWGAVRDWPTKWQEDGWHENGGSWRCPECLWIVGSNLKGERPWASVQEHKRKEHE